MIQWILVKTPRSLRLFILTAIIKLCFVEVEEGKDYVLLKSMRLIIFASRTPTLILARLVKDISAITITYV
jgi:hypothetical protein